MNDYLESFKEGSEVKYNILNAKTLIQNKFSFELMKVIMESYYPNLFEDNELLYLAELYKIVSNDQLVKTIDPTGKYMTSLKSEYIDAKFSSVVDVVHKLGFLFASYNSINDTVTLVTSLNNVSNNKVELYFPNTKVEIKAVTPLNYKLLTEIKDVKVLYKPNVLFFRIVADAIEQKATDIHFLTHKLSNDKEVYPVHYRIGNSFTARNLFSINKELNKDMIAEVIKTRTNYQTIDLDTITGVVTSCNNPFYVPGYDLRITVNRTISGYATTVRIMGATDIIQSLESLGLKPEVVKVLERVVRSNSGLTLVTGPQRSGKNTTLFAVLNQMINRPLKIMDFSSPVETLLPIVQIDYKNDVEHLNALVKSAKKHDSDIVLINELPSKDTADAVYDLVNSSVGVMTTFHIKRIWHLCYKLEEYFKENLLNIITHMNIVLTQQIFIKQCPHCLESFALSKNSNLLPEVIELAEKFGITSYMESQGCSKCNHTGVQRGIQPYVEYVIFNEDLRNELFQTKSLYEMENIIKAKVKTDGTSLEDFVIPDVINGTLHPNQLANFCN